MSKPRILDLFCCAGGAGMGYYLAGFDVTGVDINPQPSYPFRFVQGDALEYLEKHGAEYDAIHASPPCQAYTRLSTLAGGEYPDLIEATRRLLEASGKPWIIENVEGSPLINPVRLCGSSFGLGVWRHRLFESPVFLMAPTCAHCDTPEPLGVTGTGGPQKGDRKKAGGGKSRKPSCIAQAQDAMGIDWMTRKEINQAIPPAYTEFLGRQLIDSLKGCAI